MIRDATGGSRSGDRHWFAAFAGIALAAIIFAALTRGVWLDEFWSLRLGAREIPLAQLWSDRWASDPHPPLANLLYWTVSSSGVETMPGRRLLLNVPSFLAFLATTVFFALRDRNRWASFPVLLFVLALSLYGVVTAYSDYRSYGWQCTAVGALIQYGNHVLRHEHADRTADTIGAVATCAAIALHYVGGVVVSAYLGLLIAAVWHKYGAARAVRVLLPAIAGWGAMLASGAVLFQRRSADIDYSWIHTSTFQALGLFGLALAGVLLANPVATIMAMRHRLSAGPERTFALVLASAATCSAALLLGLNALTPIIIDRYLIGWQLLVVALVALACEAALARRQVSIAAVISVGVLMLSASAYAAASMPGWTVNARTIAAQVAACPSTRVYALSHWRLANTRHTNIARRETQVVADGYRRTAAPYGFTVTVLPLTSASRLTLDPRCPTMLWIEHFGVAARTTPRDVLRTADLATDRPAKASFVEGGSGVLILLVAASH